jgi:hypothetical protein
MYQLAQPPADHTVGRSRPSTSATNASWASGRGSTVATPAARMYASARSRYSTCASIISTTEVLPRPVLGPSSRNRLGKPATARPRWALGLPAHASARVRPSRPRTRSATGGSVAWNPVPKMMVSAGCSTPSSVRMPWGRTSRMAAVTSSTFGLVSAGR